MSTNLKSHAPGVSLTRFAGGVERGVCIQISMDASQEDRQNGQFARYVQLTKAQAAALAADLTDFAQSREVEDYN